jgi:threonine dehydrogenase-like Zn-dependent dehydrogenase
MKAVNYPSAGSVALADLPDPEPGPGEALIAVHASGICHTDIDVLHARYGPGAFPVVPGHEDAGEVIGVGAGVTGVSVGDRVVVDPNISCGTCRACRQGMSNLCETLGAYGVTCNGGFAELSVVRVENLVPIGEMPYEIAALAEPMGCALNGVTAVAPDAGDEALIFGAGPIGLLIGMALKTRNLSQVTFADIDPNRLELAESFGFTSVAVGSAELAAMRHAKDLTVDATGNARVAAELIGYTANGGSCLFFGVCAPDARIEVAPFEIFRRQLTLAGTHSLNHNIPEALSAIRAYGPGIAGLVSHRLSLEEVAETLSGKAPSGSLKIQAVSA